MIYRFLSIKDSNFSISGTEFKRLGASITSMKQIYAEAKTVAIWIATAIAAVCLLTAAANPARGQRDDRRPSPVERRTEVLERQGAEYDLEKSSRDLKGRPERPEDRKRAREIAEEIKHDFAGLQESHNQIVLFMADKEGLNHNLNSVFRAVAEIKKHSTRLKSKLALPKPQEEKTRVEANNEQIGELLMLLRQHIYNFVTNPLFESAGALNVEQGRKAGVDLDRIIELSESITKSAGNLKNQTKP